jgi:thioredoxin-related protein
MKKLNILFVLLLAATFTFAQDAYKAHQEGWLVDLEEAYKKSQETGKPIMANFTGSDWCGWCKRLSAAVFVKPEFKKWADENVVLLELDFPRRKQLPQNIREQNQSLQQSFKVRGYPTIWVFNLDKDAAGKYSIEALGKTGYRPSVQEFTSGVDQMLNRKNNNG